jgi:hypothetical protein
MEKAKNLKFILLAFKQLSGQKKNFHKSEFYCFGEAQDDVALDGELFGRMQGQFPIKYLSILIHYGGLQMLNGNLWRSDYKLDYLVRKANYYPCEED